MENKKNAELVEALRDKLRHRFARGFLDLLILKLIQAKPTWGYNILKKTDATFKVKLRHGALYPTLSKMEAQGLVKHRKELQKGRVRKIYEITKDGKLLLNAYYGFLMEQIPQTNMTENQETRK